MTETEQAQVGDTVRLTITRTEEGFIEEIDGQLCVNKRPIVGIGRTVEILSRAIPLLPSEPGTWWLDDSDVIWHVTDSGELYCLPFPTSNRPADYGPFRQLVVKEES